MRFATHCRLAALCAALLVVLGNAQAPKTPALYLLPLWTEFPSASEASLTQQVAELRRRLGPETPRVRLGFTSYVFISMDDWNVPVNDPAAVQKALAKNIADIDLAIDRARRHGIPLCLSFITAVRERYDPLQRAAEEADRRNMQWYADNSLANGWLTHSRYARRQRVVLEAYFRALGRVVANRMAKYPDTLVAASGDGEVELAYGKSPIVDPAYTEETMQLADYSPFAVAEFRDWLRGDGLYAPRAPFDGEAYDRSARYRGDRTPGEDTNRDGHTLNGDFHTAFTTWTLRYFDWPLSDDAGRDPHAIPASQSAAAGWTPTPEGQARGFDPPRQWREGEPWWEVWHRFRQTMIQRSNRDVVRWVTTSADPETGKTVPASRWYTDQIPADYLYGASPDAPNLRFITSASAWWTADVAPLARLGITSFNSNVNGAVFRTLAAVAPHIGARDVDWGILEWNAASPSLEDPEVYREEMRLVRLYRPSLLVPVYWQNDHERLEDTGFEVALKELVADMSRGDLAPELAVSPGRLTFTRTADGHVTPPQRLEVQIAGRGPVDWRAAAADRAVTLSTESGDHSAEVTVSIAPRTPADGEITLTIDAPATSTGRVRIPVRVRTIPTSTPPFGSIDAPAEGATVGRVVDVSGWALDDVGVAAIEAWREPRAGERPGANGLVKVDARLGPRATRPDIEKLFPDMPESGRAAWGLRMTLPAGISGTVKLHVLVTDVEGQVKDLSRTVQVR